MASLDLDYFLKQQNIMFFNLNASFNDTTVNIKLYNANKKLEGPNLK